MLTNENEVNTVPDPVTQPSLCCDLFIILVRSLFSVDLQSTACYQVSIYWRTKKHWIGIQTKIFEELSSRCYIQNYIL